MTSVLRRPAKDQRLRYTLGGVKSDAGSYLRCDVAKSASVCQSSASSPSTSATISMLAARQSNTISKIPRAVRKSNSSIPCDSSCAWTCSRSCEDTARSSSGTSDTRGPWPRRRIKMAKSLTLDLGPALCTTASLSIKVARLRYVHPYFYATVLMGCL
jgi:hypothetical protein